MMMLLYKDCADEIFILIFFSKISQLAEIIQPTPKSPGKLQVCLSCFCIFLSQVLSNIIPVHPTLLSSSLTYESCFLFHITISTECNLFG